MRLGVVSFPGSGSTIELVDALKLYFSNDVEVVHSNETDLSNYTAIFLPGGASFGDYLRPGAIASLEPVIDALRDANDNGTPIFAVGNGFQILTEAKLLPGAFQINHSLSNETSDRTVNVCESNAWLKLPSQKSLTLPRSNRFGNYYLSDSDYETLKSNQQIFLTYADDSSDSSQAVAGITNEAGNIVAMMVRPERAVDEMIGSTQGQLIFEAIQTALKQ